ncbi:MAG: hypothetical protein HC921_07690 [Synechococcaceae cyanobacterium SM2_3_1]|nr:hypothetical protein [Synechococcaceae cyanobacterium SM2_3_1]
MKPKKFEKLEQIGHLLNPLPEESQEIVSGGGDNEYKYVNVRRYYAL